ncbi:MAG TPA: MlaD family protein [Candidatus Acidoferrum sp.]|nr:MlaD family protein [Candidatus Acidoferrum sp.]
MESKREQAMVGIFVLAASAVLIATVFALTGAFGGSAATFRSYFPFAGGLEPGATVRYAGGPKVGRVERLQLDPKDPTRIEITFSVRSGLPVKTDSRVKIMSLSPLGDNHLEVLPGSEKAALASVGTILPSEPYMDFNALTAMISNLSPKTQQLLGTLNDRATELKETIDRVNDLLSNTNRKNLAGTLAETRGMIAENRAPVKSTVQNLNSASQKLEPLLQDLRKTSAQANEALGHVDSLIGDNRQDIRDAVTNLRKSLITINDLTGRLDQTLDVNSENIDELLDNLRHVSENLKEFTNTIKTRPSTLIRSSSPKEHRPGGPQ